MTASRTAQDKDFWTKMLSASKVKRILERRGFDSEAFKRDYLADRNRGPRRTQRPTDREIDAVEAFLKNGRYDELMDALDTESRPRADSALRRVMAWKAQGGVKHIRRPRGSRPSA